MTAVNLKDFYKDFDIELGLTQAQKEASYRIRFKVYCEERGLESVEQFPAHMESDEFDRNSIPILVRHRATGNYIATLRMIFRDSDASLPMEQVLNTKGQSSLVDMNSVEISRLAMPRYIETLNLIETDRSEVMQVGKMFSNALYFAASVYVANISSLTTAYAFMEHKLFRRLRQVNLDFIQLSDFVDYKGQRAVYQISSDTLKQLVASQIPEFAFETTVRMCSQINMFESMQVANEQKVVNLY